MSNRVVCAWCQEEGILTVIKDGDPTGRDSHGICPSHEEKLEAEAMRLSPDLIKEYMAGPKR